MKLSQIYLLLMVVILNSCGGGDSVGSPSSLIEGNGESVIENFTTSTGYEQNISSVITEKNGQYTIYVNENQKTAFKIRARDRSNFFYSISGKDWQDFDVDADGGNFTFKEFTDFERKKEYHFVIIATDVVGNKIRKKATIYVKDNENEHDLPKVVNKNHSLARESERKYFITTWKTDNNATLHPNQITIPTFGDGYYYSVDWGDGTSSKNVIEDITHSYKKAGTYRVKIAGKFSRIYFAKGVNQYGLPIKENNFKLISIDQWGDIEWLSMASAFIGCVNLKGQALDSPNLSHVREMYSMFYNATNFNQDIGDWDVSKVKDMYAMFFGAKAFNQDISSWDLSNVTNISNMFHNATSFNQDIANWNVSNVKNISKMFYNATDFNQNIGSWNVSNVKDMSYLFYGAKAFNQNIGSWNVSHVTNMNAMFSKAISFNKNIENWNVSHVENMGAMFNEAEVFNQNLENWNLSKVTDIGFMFNKALSFNRDIGNWDVSNVVNMESLFSDATHFNQEIGNWNVSAVKNMRWMFYGATVFNQEIGGWNVSTVTDMNSMFIQSKAFNQDISRWDVVNVTNMRRMFKFAIRFNQDLEKWKVSENIIFESFDGTLFYTREDMFYGATSMEELPPWYIELANTTINHNTPLLRSNEEQYFISTWKTDSNNVISNTTQITIPTVLGYEYDYSVDWGDGTSSTNIIGDTTHRYKKAGTYRVKIIGTFPRIHFGKDFYLTAIDANNAKILSVDQWGSNEWSSMLGSFAGCKNLEIKATDRPNLSNVTDMAAMFLSSSLVNDNIENWDVSTVTNMAWMFRNATAFNGDISSWDVSNVIYMHSMFQNATAFNQDISAWDVSNVISMGWMFNNAYLFNKNIKNWDVSKVFYMNFMFSDATAFNQDIGNWNVSSVINMSWMFSSATSFNQDVGNWNVSNVTDMRYMFQDAISFNQDIENWDVSNVKQVKNLNGNQSSAMLRMFDRTPLDKLPSWYNVNYNNKVNLKVNEIGSFSNKIYLNSKNSKRLIDYKLDLN